MKWFKVYLTGLIAWFIPFALAELVFSAIPDSFAFTIYLLACVIASTYINTSLSHGYLRRRIKLTVWSGFSMGLIWLLNAGVLHLIYSYFILEEDIYNFIFFQLPVYLMYLIVPVFHGYCEGNRARRH